MIARSALLFAKVFVRLRAKRRPTGGVHRQDAVRGPTDAAVQHPDM